MAETAIIFDGCASRTKKKIRMDNVFVTGANGLLGTNLVLQLIEQGYSVHALVRNKKNFFDTSFKNLTLIEGDLSDSEKLALQIKGCKYVVHIAANTSQKLLKLEDYYDTNVLGVQNIVDACIENHIQKLIYIGTANTFGYGNDQDLGREEYPMKFPFTESLYALSKNQAQKIVDKATAQLNITTISPTFMIGAYDSKPSSGRIILLAMDKRFVVYPSGGKNFVHVSDVANAVIKAFGLKQSGQKYILANENISYREFYKKVILQNNQKSILIPLPDVLLRLVGLFGDFIRRIGIKTDVSSINTKVLTINNFYTNRRVKQDLDIKFTPIEKAIVESLKYFKNNKK